MNKSKKLATITSGYSKRKKEYDSTGKYFAFWGIWLTLTCNIVYLTGIQNLWFFSTIAGVLVQQIGIKYCLKRQGFILKQSLIISGIWAFLALSTLLFFFVLPIVMELYPPKYILPFISIEMFMGLLITSAYLRSLPFLAGAMVYLFTGIYFKQPDNNTEVIIFSVQFMSGFFLPGLWSTYESRKKEI